MYILPAIAQRAPCDIMNQSDEYLVTYGNNNPLSGWQHSRAETETLPIAGLLSLGTWGQYPPNSEVFHQQLDS